MRTGELPDTTATVAAATLTGDIRDFMLGQAKRNTKPWDQRTEREQQSFISACNTAAEDVARKAVKVVSTRGFEAIEFTWGSIQIKDGGITAQVKCDGSVENVLAMLSGGRAIIVLAKPVDFFGERAPARAMPDQPDLMDGIDPDTGEILGEQQAASIDESEGVAETGTDGAGAAETGDDFATAHQQEALASTDATTEGSQPTGEHSHQETEASQSTAALSEQEQLDLSPEQRANVDRLSAIKPIEEADGADAGSSDGPKKRRGRRTAEQRVADNIAATSAEHRAE